MRKSTNFNLNLVEGSDLVNPLVQDVPNYETIDEQMYKNECNSIGIATELKSGTVHALTRTIPNAPMFRFKATSNFTAGDTFTVDGIQVSALTPNGETLASNSYIIGSEVLCVLRESLLTVYVSGGIVVTAQDSEKLGGQLPEYYGTAENVATALETAQSANQVTLTLQQDVRNINNNLNALSSYSIAETIVGTWVDGKSVYRRIYNATNVNISSSTLVDETFKSSDISTLIGIKFCVYADGEWFENFHSTSDREYAAYARVDAGGVRILVANVNISKYTIIIEYTKN